MIAEDAKQQQLLETLAENELVKAVLVVDEKGRIKGRRGQAICLKSTTGGAALPARLSDSDKESVYLAAAGSGDYVIVVFDVNTHFDTLKRQVDGLIASLDL